MGIFEGENSDRIMPQALGILVQGLFAVMVLIFLKHHYNLIKKNMTTVEYLESKRRENAKSYDIGFKKNFLQIFGTNYYTWIFPLAPDL